MKYLLKKTQLCEFYLTTLVAAFMLSEMDDWMSDKESDDDEDDDDNGLDGSQKKPKKSKKGQTKKKKRGHQGTFCLATFI